ncbi:hypothetical protein [Acidovorax sp. SUPP2825]|uniref:BRCT domain-containing protein n=1 Tax=Acidovorax sp. SUPP2825 TaxID=2920879 RepID=UPI0023DE270C|nr:hypothetical protein [Acidovorax sp. SUPP2825]GKS93216.1 hypothetical protein AVAK2825_01795 [Acidovorax sp. SUPP2825]
MEVLQFTYTNAAGESKLRVVSAWTEEGHYIVGNDAQAGGSPRTFRKDRISEYLAGCEAALKTPFAGPPPQLSRSEPEESRPQILFTGFPAAMREALELECVTAGLCVVKTVTQRLVFLCAGPNAGPSKISKARIQGAFIVTQLDLPELLQSGVLPDRIFD